jgi:hypothetical protein
VAINATRVVAGGLAAGVVLNAVNVGAQLALMDRLVREVNAWMPGAASRMGTGGAAIAAGVLLKLVLGVLLVWLYAALRPRFGPGPRTAVYAALFMWILSGIFDSDFMMIGMMSFGTYATLTFIQLAGLLFASWAGAWLYVE